MDDAAPPLLLFVVGPLAVGKMSVGQAITERTGMRLFHNHISIDLALRYFDYGTPAFHRIVGQIRRLVNECASRLAEKPSMRDLTASRRPLLEPTHGTSSTPTGGSTSARTTCVSTARS